MNKVKVGIITVVAAVTLTGCYAKGEVMEVEVETNEHGQEYKEIEVARSEGTEPDSYEKDVPADSRCDLGDIYPDCNK